MPFILVSFDGIDSYGVEREDGTWDFDDGQCESTGGPKAVKARATRFATRVDAVAAYFRVKDIEGDDDDMPPLLIRKVRK